MMLLQSDGNIITTCSHSGAVGYGIDEEEWNLSYLLFKPVFTNHTQHSIQTANSLAHSNAVGTSAFIP
jgi:hypothetical protein